MIKFSMLPLKIQMIVRVNLYASLAAAILFTKVQSLVKNRIATYGFVGVFLSSLGIYLTIYHAQDPPPDAYTVKKTAESYLSQRQLNELKSYLNEIKKHPTLNDAHNLYFGLLLHSSDGSTTNPIDYYARVSSESEFYEQSRMRIFNVWVSETNSVEFEYLDSMLKELSDNFRKGFFYYYLLALNDHRKNAEFVEKRFIEFQSKYRKSFDFTSMNMRFNVMNKNNILASIDIENMQKLNAITHSFLTNLGDRYYKKCDLKNFSRIAKMYKIITKKNAGKLKHNAILWGYRMYGIKLYDSRERNMKYQLENFKKICNIS